MVALQTSDPNPRTEPIERVSHLRAVASPQVANPVGSQRWSAGHPAVRAYRGELAAKSDAAPMGPARALRAVPVAGSHRRSPWVYLRRRAVAAVVLLALMWAAVAVVTELVGGGSGSAGASQELRSHVVVTGETWWSLANELGRPGDIRDTVDSLIELNGAEDLRAGQRVVLPLG